MLPANNILTESNEALAPRDVGGDFTSGLPRSLPLSNSLPTAEIDPDDIMAAISYENGVLPSSQVDTQLPAGPRNAGSRRESAIEADSLVYQQREVNWQAKKDRYQAILDRYDRGS